MLVVFMITVRPVTWKYVTPSKVLYSRVGMLAVNVVESVVVIDTQSDLVGCASSAAKLLEHTKRRMLAMRIADRLARKEDMVGP